MSRCKKMTREKFITKGEEQFLQKVDREKRKRKRRGSIVRVFLWKKTMTKVKVK